MFFFPTFFFLLCQEPRTRQTYLLPFVGRFLFSVHPLRAFPFSGPGISALGAHSRFPPSSGPGTALVTAWVPGPWWCWGHSPRWLQEQLTSWDSWFWLFLASKNCPTFFQLNHIFQNIFYNWFSVPVSQYLSLVIFPEAGISRVNSPISDQ